MAARRRLRALGVPPGAAGLRAALAEFRRGGPGVATAFSDPSLRLLHDFVAGEGDVAVELLGNVVGRMLRFCDESPPAQARSGHYLAALALACESLDADSPFRACATFPGFHRALARTLRELHAWGIGADELDAACSSSQSSAASKFAALAALDREALQTLSVLGREPSHSHLARSLECKPSEQAVLGRLFIGASECDEPLSAAWVRWLADIGVDVTVAVEQPYSGLFGRSETFAAMLGVPIEPLGQAIGLSAALFSDRVAVDRASVHIESAADALAEAEWAIRGCLRDLEAGISPGQIGLYVRDLEKYAPFLTAAAARFNVKLRMHLRAPLLTNRFARLTLDAIEFCALDDPRLIAPLLQSSYLGLSREDQMEIRNAARDAFKAKKNAWPVFLGWSQAHESRWPWLRRLNQWREECAGKPVPLFAWADRLRTLMDLLPVFDQEREGPTRRRDNHAMSALQRAVAQAASVRRAGDRDLFSLGEFAHLCRSWWHEEEYTIPSEPMGIQVCSTANALGELRSLTALGMLEGVFPKRRSEDPILADTERNELSAILGLTPALSTSVDRARQEREEFARVCAAASERLTLTYPLTDESRDNVPAFYLIEAERAAGGRECVSRLDHSRVSWAPEAGECLAEADRRLREAFDAPREDPLPIGLEDEAALAIASWAEGRSFEPRDLRDAIRCEFQHLARRRLGLRPSDDGRKWGIVRRLPEQVQLLRQATPEQAESALHTALEAELDQWYGDVPDWELAMLRSGGRRLIRDWVKREFAARALWPKDEGSLQIHPRFGSDELRARMPGGVDLEGSVAATSEMGPYRVTHLYESRPPKPEDKFGLKLAEADLLYYGLYLLSRHTQGTQSAVEVETMRGGRKLLVLQRLPRPSLPSRQQDEVDVVDLSSGGDGALASRGLFEEVKRRIVLAAGKLRAGAVEPRPGEHCAWCAYGELCRRSSEYGESDSPFGFEEGDDEV